MSDTTRTIWKCPLGLDQANALARGTALENLGIELTEIGGDFLAARMPVDHRTRQPAGVLHGGASVLLAETLASWAATFCVDTSRQHCVGLEINANHLRPVAEGFVYGTARPLHLGRTTQVWQVSIENQSGKVVCISRVTMAVLTQPSGYLDGLPRPEDT
jgi:1,4-dihydroxy-2-naphthoyl-CoA hydrolase